MNVSEKNIIDINLSPNQLVNLYSSLYEDEYNLYPSLCGYQEAISEYTLYNKNL